MDEALQVEDFNREEFQEFTQVWDDKIKILKEHISIQVGNLASNHVKSMEELQVYLQNSMTTRYRPSAELLNLRKIQQVLSKQKNYTEAKRIQQTVVKLEKKEQALFMKQREEKIATQLNHLSVK